MLKKIKCNILSILVPSILIGFGVYILINLGIHIHNNGFGVAAVARILIIERFRGSGSSKSHCRNQVSEHAKTTGGR